MPTKKEQQFYIEQSKKLMEQDRDIEGICVIVAKKNGDVLTIPGIKSAQGLELLCRASQELPEMMLKTLERKQGQTKQRVH